MREIKFRGKRVDNGEWVYGGILITKENSIIITGILDRGYQFATYIIVIPETVGQFTSLKDKNGVDIYEGDNLLVNYNYLGVVVPKLENGKFLPNDYDLKRCEVIGSIHENPETL